METFFGSVIGSAIGICIACAIANIAKAIRDRMSR